jgi:hypothetical protein
MMIEPNYYGECLIPTGTISKPSGSRLARADIALPRRRLLAGPGFRSRIGVIPLRRLALLSQLAEPVRFAAVQYRRQSQLPLWIFAAATPQPSC